MSKKPNPIPGNKPFQKGQSGNPNGRPKLRDIKEVLTDLLSQEKNKQQLVDAVMTVVVNKALKGDLKAADMLLSYTYGKPTQKTEITGADGERIDFKVEVIQGDKNIPYKPEQ